MMLNFWEVSCFPFENYLQSVKRMVRCGKHPVKEIVGRIMERRSMIKQPKVVTGKLNNQKANCFLTHSGSIVFILNVDETGYGMMCRVYATTNTNSFFEDFCDSKDPNIFVLTNQTVFAERIVNKSEIWRKCICIPYKTKRVVIGLLNDFTS